MTLSTAPCSLAVSINAWQACERSGVAEDEMRDRVGVGITGEAVGSQQHYVARLEGSGEEIGLDGFRSPDGACDQRLQRRRSCVVRAHDSVAYLLGNVRVVEGDLGTSARCEENTRGCRRHFRSRSCGHRCKPQPASCPCRAILRCPAQANIPAGLHGGLSGITAAPPVSRTCPVD